MNITEKKAFSRRLIETVWNKGMVDEIPKFVTQNFVYIDPSASAEYKGPEALKKYVLTVRKAFPDLNCKIEDQICEGEKLVTLIKISATHENEFLGVPASHKTATLPMVVIEKFDGDKIAEVFALWDALTFLRTAGVFGAPAFAGVHV